MRCYGAASAPGLRHTLTHALHSQVLLGQPGDLPSISQHASHSSWCKVEAGCKHKHFQTNIGCHYRLSFSDQRCMHHALQKCRGPTSTKQPPCTGAVTVTHSPTTTGTTQGQTCTGTTGVSHIVPPPVAALAAVEEQRHALLCAGREEHRLVVRALGAGHILGAREGGIGPNILQDDRPLLVGVGDLVPVQCNKVKLQHPPYCNASPYSVRKLAQQVVCVCDRCSMSGFHTCRRSSLRDLRPPDTRSCGSDTQASSAPCPPLGTADRCSLGRTSAVAPCWTSCPRTRLHPDILRSSSMKILEHLPCLGSSPFLQVGLVLLEARARRAQHMHVNAAFWRCWMT